MKALLVLIALVLFTISISYCQSTDRMKYYILYDKSGSVSKNDKFHGNLKKFLETMIELRREKSVKSKTSISTITDFEIYFFGEEKQITDDNIINFHVTDTTNPKKIKVMVNLFEKNTNLRNNRAIKLTNLHAALDLVLKNIERASNKNVSKIKDKYTNTDQDPYVSKGVFIFTDGRLKIGDFDTDEIDKSNSRSSEEKLKSYYAILQNKMNSIQILTKNPIFLIQTSYSPNNKYYKGLSKNKFKGKDTTFINDSTIFWLQNTIPFKPEDKTNPITLAFQDFMARSDDKIISDKNDEIPKNPESNDTVNKAILIQNIATIKDFSNNLKKSGGNFNDKLSFGYKIDKVLNNQDSTILKILALLNNTYDNKSDPKNENINSGKQTQSNSKIINKGENEQNSDGKNDNTSVTNNAEVGNLKITDNIITKPELIKVLDFINKIPLSTLKEAENKITEAYKNNSYTSDYKQNNLPQPLINPNEYPLVFNNTSPIKTSTVTNNAQSHNLEQNVILGVTDYLIERAKDEAVYSLMEYLKENIFDKNSNIKKLLPEFDEKLKDSSNYYDMALLKESIKRDLDNLPKTLMTLPNIYQAKKELMGIVAILFLFDNISKKENLEIAFKDLGGIIERNWSNNLDNEVLDAMYFMTKMIGYLSTNDVSKLYDDKNKFENLAKILVIESLNKKTIDRLDSLNLTKCADLVREIYTNYKQVGGQILFIENLLKNNQTNITDFDKFRKMQMDGIADILTRSADLMQTGFKLLELLRYSRKEVNFNADDIKNLQNDITKGIDAYFLIKNKDYTQATILLAPLLIDVLPKPNKTPIKQYYYDVKKYQIDSNQYVIDITAYKKNIKTSLGDSTNYTNQLLKFIYVAGEVSEAQSAEDVKKIIAKYAMPVASYRIKHETRWDILINAYMGFGFSYILATSRGIQNTFKPAISTPIGVEWSHKIFNQYYRSIFNQPTFSIFTTIFDVGNVVTSKLWNNSNQNDNLNLQNIVSPGIFLIFEPNKKVPLSLNLGYAFNPERLSLSINLDLPLFMIRRGLKK